MNDDHPLDELTDCVEAHFLPKDEPKDAVLQQTVAVFVEAQRQAIESEPPKILRTPAADDQGVTLRAALDQAKELIREKSAKAEPRAQELKRRLEADPHANDNLIAAAERKIIAVVKQLYDKHRILTVTKLLEPEFATVGDEVASADAE